MKLTPEEVQEMIDMVEVKQDKKIEYSEFVTLFMGELEEQNYYGTPRIYKILCTKSKS